MIGNQAEGAYPAPLAVGFGFSDWVANHLLRADTFASLLKNQMDALRNKCDNNVKQQYNFQSLKHQVWNSLDADERGPYIPYEHYQEAFEKKLQKSSLDKTYPATGDTPTMIVQCFLPDLHRIQCLVQMNQSKGGAIVADSPGLAQAEELRKAAFEAAMRRMQQGRKLVRTHDNLLGLGPKSTQVGDQVWVLPGAKVPFVLRPFGEGGKKHRLIGEAYVHGFMDGEATRQGRELQPITLY
ncbi:hypothetical protein BDV96DRAFT_601829 [Lophiotrema nucula]|uniref:Uncharacterized protein n=1 Tax=Lophiotrema nucula TaxID=690887 RepID=A0A6A5Z1W7_9PLEO|nr:hypothetical protein BDV96DRAFT_601829 [Lophiotrema nucula]